VRVRGGNYRPTNSLVVVQPGLALRAQDGESVLLDFQDAGNVGGVKLQADSVLLEGFEITNAQLDCVQGSVVSTQAVVRRNHIHHCGLFKSAGNYGSCIEAFGSGTLIEKNHVHYSNAQLIYVVGNEITIRNNLIYDAIPPEA